MTVLKLRHQTVGRRIHVNVWAGENPAGLYWAGRLMLRPDDWKALQERLQFGVAGTIGGAADVIVEEGP